MKTPGKKGGLKYQPSLLSSDIRVDGVVYTANVIARIFA